MTEGTTAEKLERLKDALRDAECVLIGAGAGLSTSAGFEYSGPRFRQFFSEFEAKYGFHDMYSGGFYPYATPEEKWAFWSWYIAVNRYMDPPKSTYHDLLDLVRKKDFFAITTNVDHCFQKAGFPKDRLFYTQGDFGLFQCSGPCCDETFENEEIVLEMIARQEHLRIPTELIPKCPRCGRPLTTNLRADDRFVEDEGWHRAAENYVNFVKAHAGKKILLLELGVGFNTPSIIKYPFWQMTAENPQAVYACLNLDEALCPKEIAGRSICIEGDIHHTLQELRA